MANRETKPRVGGPEVPSKDLFRFDGRTVLSESRFYLATHILTQVCFMYGIRG